MVKNKVNIKKKGLIEKCWLKVELAKHLNISPSNITNLVNSGRLRVIENNGTEFVLWPDRMAKYKPYKK